MSRKAENVATCGKRRTNTPMPLHPHTPIRPIAVEPSIRRSHWCDQAKQATPDNWGRYPMRLIACLLLALPFSVQAQARTCLVVGVSDGDTLTARCGSPGDYEQVKVRIAAIDAPESRQPYGQRSKQALSSLCYMERARISPRDTDRYGRIVADVRCRGEDAGRHQVAGGWAWVYEQYATRDDGALFKIQYTARAQHLGLWADREPLAPWEWRKAQRDG